MKSPPGTQNYDAKFGSCRSSWAEKPATETEARLVRIAKYILDEYDRAGPEIPLAAELLTAEHWQAVCRGWSGDVPDASRNKINDFVALQTKVILEDSKYSPSQQVQILRAMIRALY
ncbi:hypothetical protein ACFSR7_05950 [Cohnella sp. GCM10020058]|uniref:hypothetical protein n=1 Tax=Cohnella sp. GCM10020058 TaxID=3317330 RepID=UPI00362526D9